MWVDTVHLRRLSDAVKDSVEIADNGADQKTGESVLERRSACMVFENWQFTGQNCS